MHVLLWVLQAIGALLYGASGVMKAFTFDRISQGRAVLRRNATQGLDDFRHPAAILAVGSLVFIGVHVNHRELTPVILSAVPGLAMAFVAYSRRHGA